MLHPCLSCGACCAAYRVAFHWSQADPALGGTVPEAAVVRWDAHRLALRGTDRKQPRCMQLQGEIGRDVRCSIYPQRPEPCRILRASFENGHPSDQCDRARLRHGLTPLTPLAWGQVECEKERSEGCDAF